jgi:hypothetical protein
MVDDMKLGDRVKKRLGLRDVCVKLLILEAKAGSYFKDKDNPPDTPGTNFELLNLVLDIIGVPPVSRNFSRDWIEERCSNIMRPNRRSVTRFMNWLHKELLLMAEWAEDEKPRDWKKWLEQVKAWETE